MSVETKPCGAISANEPQTPSAQARLMSSEDLRWIMRAINGIFQSGNVIDAIKAIFSNMAGIITDYRPKTKD